VLVASLGRYDDAVGAAERATERDPLDARSWAALAFAYDARGDLELAERASRRSLAVSPEGIGLVPLGYTLLLASKPAEAQAAFVRAPAVYRLWGTAMAEHALGHPAAAKAALDELEAKSGHVAAMLAAEVHAWRNEKDLAFSWIDRAVANGEHEASMVRSHPILARLGSDARFAAHLRRMKLPVD
jgi:serine/threonine-protein kinase